VPELVGCDLDRAAEFVGDRVGQPSLETHVESSRVDGESTVGVGVSARQQHGGIGEPLSGADLLGLDHGGEFVVDGDHGVTTHLVVAVTQVDRALVVADQAVQPQSGGVADA